MDIQSVIVRDRVNDEIQFLVCLHLCPNLNELELNGPKLSQMFYNIVPGVTSSLTKLTINDVEIGLNFDFLFKMQMLMEFR